MITDLARQALHHYFGYQSFRPAQEPVVASILKGQDCLAIMPTGAGKSICFQVPSLLRRGITLVFTPLIALMKDQVDGLCLQNIPATFLNSSLSSDEFGRRVNAINQGRIKLVYLAPERLEVSWFIQLLLTLPIEQIVIDEAHCVSQWGHDFRPSYQLIAPFVAKLPKKPVVAAFTATATPEVKHDIKKLLNLENANIFVSGFDRPNLQFRVVRGEKKIEYILDYVRRHHDESGIIYCATRKDVEKVYSALIKNGVKAGYYHGGLDDEIRREQQEYYIYDKIQVMVATNAFGMGIDKSNVRYVLHYQMPRNMESYYQEAGRAGRDGAPGECVLLYSGRDVLIHQFLIEQAKLEPARNQLELNRLQQVIDYCFYGQCLRTYILRYFGETTAQHRCMNCSNCLGLTVEKNLTDEAKKVFRAILALEQRYGINFLADFITGVENERIRRLGYHHLIEFGALQSWSLGEVKELVKVLVATGYVENSGGKYPILSLAEPAYQVLHGLLEVKLITPQLMKSMTNHVVKRKTSKSGKSLFSHLREHRKNVAHQEGVPPYLIFSDTVLIDMAALKPKTLAEFYTLKGVGEVKLQKYGLSFLKAIAAYKEE